LKIFCDFGIFSIISLRVWLKSEPQVDTDLDRIDRIFQSHREQEDTENFQFFRHGLTRFWFRHRDTESTESAENFKFVVKK